MAICECCGNHIPDDELIECPICGLLVCFWCYDGEMCDDCPFRNTIIDGCSTF